MPWEPPRDYLQVICFGDTGGSHDKQSEHILCISGMRGALEVESVKLPRGSIPAMCF